MDVLYFGIFIILTASPPKPPFFYRGGVLVGEAGVAGGVYGFDGRTSKPRGVYDPVI